MYMLMRNNKGSSMVFKDKEELSLVILCDVYFLSLQLVPVTKKRRKLLKDGKLINNHILGTIPSDHDLEEVGYELDEVITF